MNGDVDMVVDHNKGCPVHEVRFGWKGNASSILYDQKLTIDCNSGSQGSNTIKQDILSPALRACAGVQHSYVWQWLHQSVKKNFVW